MYSTSITSAEQRWHSLFFISTPHPDPLFFYWTLYNNLGIGFRSWDRRHVHWGKSGSFCNTPPRHDHLKQQSISHSNSCLIPVPVLKSTFVISRNPNNANHTALLMNGKCFFSDNKHIHSLHQNNKPLIRHYFANIRL
jgi:hypothetical protein